MRSVLEGMHDIKIDNQTLLDMETNILMSLDFDVRFLSPIVFLERF